MFSRLAACSRLKRSDSLLELTTVCMSLRTCHVLSQNMTHAEANSLSTKSAAARLLSISRRTVQRNCDLYEATRLRLPKLPPICDQRGKVYVGTLSEFIRVRKQRDGRGFPLGQKRFGSQTRFEILKGPDGKHSWTRLPRRQSKTFGRTFEKRLEIIRREIDAMTDYEQSVLIAQSHRMFLEMFRPAAREIENNRVKLRECLASGQRLTVIHVPPRPRRA